MASNWLDNKMSELGKLPCPDCEQYISSLGHHWKESPSCRPSITDFQHEVITGLMMGDGCIKRSGTPVLQCGMTSKNYLKYLDEKVFPAIGRGVSEMFSAEESAQNAMDSGLVGASGNISNYNTVYMWYTAAHPELEEYKRWYNTGEKVWPDNIILTPTILKHWYCGDGTYDNSGTQNRIVIAMSNERDSKEKVNNMFTESGLPEPSNYNESERKDGSMNCRVEFTVEQSKELWDFMGEPLPDFEYKWPK